MNRFQSSTERSNCSMQSGPQLWAFVTLHSNKAVNAPVVVSLWGLLASLYTFLALRTKVSVLSLEIYLCPKIR